MFSPIRCTAIVFGAFAVILAWIPSPIDPKPYIFQKKPPVLNGPLQPNTKLQSAKKLFENKLIGPESFAVDGQGRIFTGTSDGSVWRIDNDTYATIITKSGINHALCGTVQYEPLCGRIKGMKFHQDGYLYVVDTYKGLLRIDTSTGNVTSLMTEVNGLPFKFLNGLDISSDGTIYFTDSSSKWSRREYAYEVIELNSLGRVIAYTPSKTRGELLLDGLFLANGIALSPDESFLIVSEMSLSRIRKLYLTGPKQGQDELFIDNLPGYPDNIKRTSWGTFLVGLASTRFHGSSPLGSFLDLISPYPAVKRFVAKVIPFSFYSAVIPKHSILLELDIDGNIVNSFHDPAGKVIISGVSEGFECNESIYLGHYAHPFVGKIPIF